MSIEKKIFAANFCSCKFDLKKKWFVKIKVPDFVKGCFVWKKCYGDVNKHTTVESRLQALKELADHIELTQDYKSVQGSRRFGYQNETFVTDTIHQFYKLLELCSNNVRTSSYRKYKGLIRNLEVWLIENNKPKLPVGAFTEDDAILFLNYIKKTKGMSSASYNDHIVLFRRFYKQLIRQGIAKLNPFAELRTIPKRSVPSLYFSKAQTAELREVISKKDPQLWQIVQFIYYCFIRPGELRQLQIGDINLEEARILIREEISKTKKSQYVSIPRQLMQTISKMALENYPAEFFVFGRFGKPAASMVGVNNFKNRHQAILKGLGYSIRHKLYSWKHTGAINCAKSGMDLKDLQMQLRHHSLDQVNEYLADMLVFESDFIKYNFPEIGMMMQAS